MLDALIMMDDRQRMVPVDRAELRRAVDRLEQEGSSVSALRHAGVGLVALGEYERAEQVLLRALVLAKQEEEAAAEGSRQPGGAMESASELGADEAEREAREPGARSIPVLINLGDAYRYGGQFGRAQARYEQALTLARRHRRDLVDFALQHLGKCHLEQGQFGKASECLQEALTLRRTKGDAGLIRSTEAALGLLPAGDLTVRPAERAT
jgi:tetratricopeptide (TPR) repeat protein